MEAFKFHNHYRSSPRLEATTKKPKFTSLGKTKLAAPEMSESDKGDDSEEERSKHVDNSGAKARRHATTA